MDLVRFLMESEDFGNNDLLFQLKHFLNERL